VRIINTACALNVDEVWLVGSSGKITRRMGPNCDRRRSRFADIAVIFVAMVKIRLRRIGKKKQPTYRVVVADARAPRDGRFIESIGRYAPRNEPSIVEIDQERALEWLGKGAQPTEAVTKLLKIAGVLDEKGSRRAPTAAQ